MNSLHISRILRIFFPAVFMIALTTVPLEAAYADMDRYVQRAEKAMEEKSPAMAIGMYSQLLKEYSPDASKEEQEKYAATFMKASDVCFSQNRFLESLEFATYGLKAAEKAGDSHMTMRLIGNIGKLHGAFDDYERSVAYYLRGYRIALEKNDPIYQYKFLLSLTTAYAGSGNTEKAKECFRKLMLVPVEKENPETRFFNNYLHGIIASSEKNHLLARFQHKSALDIATSYGFPPYFSINQNWEIGRTYLATQQPDSAQYYFDIALKEALGTNQLVHTPKIYLSMSEIAKTRGDSAEYTRLRRLEQEATDAFFNTTQYNSKRNQLVEYEEMVKDSTIRDLNDRVVMQWTFIGAGILIIITVGIFYFILMKKNRDLKFANSKLVDRNRELIRAEEANQRLMDKQLESAEAADSDPEAPVDESALDASPEIIKEEGAKTDAAAPDAPANETKQTYLKDDQIEILLTRIRKALKDKSLLFNPDFSLNMLAQAVKSNTKYVSWVINQTYNKNFKTILNELRIKEASKMLDDFENYGSYTIQAITECVGYKSATSFIIAFKKMVGMTPSVYQKLAKERLATASDSSDTTDATHTPS